MPPDSKPRPPEEGAQHEVPIAGERVDDVILGDESAGINDKIPGEQAEAERDVPAPYGSDLAPQHRDLIVGSAISPEVAAARGYRTVTVKADLERLGFARNQCRVPALLIPIYDVHGLMALYQLRPDQPRIHDRKAIKYETPRGSRLIIDVPPVVRASGDLSHGSKPLFITEGVRKADAGASVGLCIVALLGVWNFRGTNELGGKTALGDWESIHLKGRPVFICFDSDVMQKVQVAQAMTRLKAFLDGRGASVQLVYLPDGPGGSKQGLDDFLASGKTVVDLLACATSEIRRAPEEERRPIGADYFVQEGSTYHWRHTTDEPVADLLANFSALIVGDIEVDDGVETHREFEVEATIGGQTRSTTVTVPAFQAMTWPSELLGAKAAIGPGISTRDQMRFAVQVLSPAVPRRTVYTHTGWRKIDGAGWCYLHAGGAQGPEGPSPEVQTRLPAALAAFALPTVPNPEQIVQATGRALDLLRLGPPRVMYPLLGLVWRAVLGDCDLSGFLVGGTGRFKTETATLAQSFFAPAVTARNLPCSWSGTANSVEVIAFHAKDMLLVVDDFKPVGTSHDVARKHAQADQLLRAQGNRAGRSRLRPDTSLRQTKPPRALILSTGEDLPVGASLNARMVVIELQPGDISVPELTRCQADAAAGFYGLAMAGLVQGIAEDFDAKLGQFRERAAELRAAADGSGGHSRTPSNFAALQAAWELFLAHAVQIGVIDNERAEYERRASWNALLAVGERQAEHQAQFDDVDSFIRLLSAGVASGQAHLADRAGGPPTTRSPATCGWRRLDSATASSWREQGMRIGWIDGDLVYLIPEAAYSVAQRMASDTECLTTTKRTLITRLAEAGHLVRQDKGRNKHVVRVQIGDGRVNALCMDASLLLGRALGAHQAQIANGEGKGGDSGLESWARDAGGVESSGPSFGPASPPAGASPIRNGPDPEHETRLGGARDASGGHVEADDADGEGEWKL